MVLSWLRMPPGEMGEPKRLRKMGPWDLWRKEINDALKMRFQGSDEPMAIVEVKLLGKGTKDGYAKVTENICGIMQSYGVEGKRCYVKYDEVEHWGMDSFMF